MKWSTGTTNFPTYPQELYNQAKSNRKSSLTSSSVQSSHSVVSDPLWPHGLQHTRLPCLSPAQTRIRQVSDAISYSVLLLYPFLLPPSIFPSVKIFSNESVLHIRWPKYWSFSFIISPSNEYSGLIYFMIDWFDLAFSYSIVLCVCVYLLLFCFVF